MNRPFANMATLPSNFPERLVKVLALLLYRDLMDDISKYGENFAD